MVHFAGLLAMAHDALMRHDYDPRYFATNAKGRICSPALPEVKTLSFRGAIARVAPSNKAQWALMGWLGEQRIIKPGMEPKTKEHALAVIKEAKDILSSTRVAA